ncbi:MAG: hypothetical protein NTU41_14565 [Chloroflexi bacterium]|nr:hypothetical protein [Chloroflexota bacterium]
MRTPKVMRLLDPSVGLMECKVCGRRHIASLRHGGYYMRGSWQCLNGCGLEDLRNGVSPELGEPRLEKGANK